MSDSNAGRTAVEGSCHCQAANWSFDGTPVSATACNCSICRRHGALWAYGFFNESIAVAGNTRAYLWGRKSLEFHFCDTCGCVVYWRAASPGADGRRYGAINLRLALHPGLVSAVPLIHHDTSNMSDLPPDGMCVSDVWA